MNKEEIIKALEAILDGAVFWTNHYHPYIYTKNPYYSPECLNDGESPALTIDFKVLLDLLKK